MAPEILDDLLDRVPRGGTVLDPMCGSGTVVRKAALSEKRAIGSDTDPLALLMTSVATGKVEQSEATKPLERLLGYVVKYQHRLNPVFTCSETLEFADYWFAEEQRLQLNALARGIRNLEASGVPRRVLNVFRLALSRTIITKSTGASLAADVSHSRPHRVRESNDYDVLSKFERYVGAILTEVCQQEMFYPAKILRNDARVLQSITNSTVDMIITSPPYLNALDYLRAHRMSLIWLGSTIPELRKLRSENIGTERSLSDGTSSTVSEKQILKHFPGFAELSNRRRNMTLRFVADLSMICKQFSRVLKKRGTLHVVIGNSTLNGVYIPNSDLFALCARGFGFRLKSELEREIPENKRYLPLSNGSQALKKRMRTEVVQTYVRTTP